MTNIVLNESMAAFHPGYYIDQYLQNNGMSQRELAERLGVSAKTVNYLINGKINLNDNLITGLSLVLGTSEQLWKNLNIKYLEKKKQIEYENNINADIPVLKKIDYSFFSKNNFTKTTSNPRERIEELRRFFKITNLQILEKRDFLVQYKSAVTNIEDKHIINSNAWVQTALNIGANINVSDVNLDYLKQSLPKIRKMSQEDPQVFLPKLRNIFNKCGVAFVIIPNLQNCGINGAVKWLGDNKVLLALNDRRKYSDIFWFALFHEIRHVFQRRTKHLIVSTDKSLNIDSNINIQNLEADADNFAQNFLIPKSEYNSFVNKGDFSYNSVKAFANKLEIQPGIVVGRLQRDNYINFSQLNGLKQKYSISIKQL